METTLDSTKFALRLQKIMETHQLSATAFAEKLEVGRATISHLMSGRNKPSLDFVMKVVSTFPEVDLQELLYGVKKTPTLRTSRVETLKQFQANTSRQVLDTLSDTALLEQSKKAASQKSIDRIVIFYNDGTFTNHKPDDSL